MALVPQDKKVKIELILGYLRGKIGDARTKLHEETNPGGKYDATYVSGLDASVKSDIGDIIKMLRWLAINESFAVPTEFLDAEVDAINPEIRQTEDGL
jgi:hypothetical protein